MCNSSPPEFDITKINGFNAEEHVGLEFLRKDARDVPSNVKVIEVDEETGRIMLEYIHGGLE